MFGRPAAPVARVRACRDSERRRAGVYRTAESRYAVDSLPRRRSRATGERPEPLPVRAQPAVDGADRWTDQRYPRHAGWPPVGAVFTGLPVRHSQIAQEALDLLVVRVAPAPGFNTAHEHMIRERLKERMGNVRVLIQRVAEVPRTASGKLRAVVSNLTAEQRGAALGRI